MKLLKAAIALLSFVGSLILGLTAIEQFEHFQEASHTYHTQFHLINIMGLVAAAVALMAFAVVLALQVVCDLDFDESPVSLDQYVGSVVFGTLGALAVGLAIYQEDVQKGQALPRHFGNGYHTGDSTLLFFIGVALIMLSVYYLMRGPDRQHNARSVTAPAPETQDQPDPQEAVASAAPTSPPDAPDTPATQPLTPQERAVPCSGSMTAIINCEVDDDRITATYIGSARDVQAAVGHLVDEVFPEDNAG